MLLALDFLQHLLHSQFTVAALFLFVVGLGLIALTSFWPQSSKPVVTAVWPVKTRRIEIAPHETDIVAGAETETTGPVVAYARAVTWPALVDPDETRLSQAERLHVIEGLGIAGDAWCASVLRRAYDEEEDELRIAVVEALGTCEGDTVAPVLERAYASHVIAERYAAVDGASRRADIALLERALRDTDGTVALAAAYGLHRANRNDLIDTALTGRNDARANEIRRVLPILA